jgi:hypothetical protein
MRLGGQLAGVDAGVDAQHLGVVARRRRAMHPQERDAVAAVGLLHRRAGEGAKRCRILDHALLHRRFEPAGKGEAAHREHRIPELQEPGKVRRTQRRRGGGVRRHPSVSPAA